MDILWRSSFSLIMGKTSWNLGAQSFFFSDHVIWAEETTKAYKTGNQLFLCLVIWSGRITNSIRRGSWNVIFLLVSVEELKEVLLAVGEYTARHLQHE